MMTLPEITDTAPPARETPVGVLVRAATHPSATPREKSLAFGQIVARFQDMAFGAAYSTLGDTYLAEDAAQEAFLTAWRELDNLREPDAFPGWFQRIVRTQCHRLTRGKRLPSVSFDLIGDMPANRGSDPALLIERQERDTAVHQALAALPEHERAATLLYYLDEYGQSEIANFLGVPVTTIKKRIFSARKRLRERMTPYMQPETPRSVEGILREAVAAARPSNAPAFARAIALRAAIESGDSATVQSLLTQDATLVRSADADGMTPLHKAVFLGYPAIVTALIEAGADVNARDTAGRTPLHTLATGPALIVIAERLLAAGADQNAADTAGRTPVRVATERAIPLVEDRGDGFALAEFLLEHRATMDLYTAAALDRATDIVRLAEANPASISQADSDGNTPLHIAARAGWRRVVQALLDAGADRDARNREGRTPLHLAAQPGRARRQMAQSGIITLLRHRKAAVDVFATALLGDTEQLRALLAQDPALRDARDASGATPLLLSAWQGHREIVEILLDAGADATARDASGRSSTSVRWHPADVSPAIIDRLTATGDLLDLHTALALGRRETILAILTADPSLATHEMVSWAIENGCTAEAVDCLVLQGAPLWVLNAAALGLTDALQTQIAADSDAPHRRDSRRNTPLHRAAERGHREAVQILLSVGAGVNAIADDGATPLHRAAANGHHATVALLLEHGADATHSNFRGESALFAACAGEDAELVGLLLNVDTPVNTVAAGKETPLHIAAATGNAEMVRLLLIAGADKTAKNYWGGTPLHVATREGKVAVAELLINAGSEITARDQWHRTPLHTAAWFGQPAIAQLLLDAGVAVTELSYGYSTPLHTAAVAGHTEVAALLLDRGAEVNFRTDFGRTPLHDAVQGDHPEMVRLLLDRGADPNSANDRKFTPLHWAAAAGKLELVRLLCDAGADTTLLSHKDETPRDLALRHGHKKVVEILNAVD